MADVKKQVPQKKKKKKEIRRMTYCMLCRVNFDTGNHHDHMHSVGHHRQLEKFKGSNYSHKCQACGAEYEGMKKYELHISTIEHKAKVKTLVLSRKKPLSIENYLDKATIAIIRTKNKAQSRFEKKERNKVKKAELKKAMKGAEGGVSKSPKQQNQKQQNQKQQNQKQQNQKQQNQKQQNQKQQNRVKQEKTAKQPKEPASKQLQQNAQNKENRLGWRLPGQQAAPHQQTEAPPSQSERRRYNVQNVQSASSQREGCDVPMSAPDQSTWSNGTQGGYSSSSGTDFTSDSLPQTGALVFDGHKCTTQDSGAGLPRTLASISRLKGGSPAPPHSPAPPQDEGTGPIRGEDVHKMLSNVRKALQMEKGGKAPGAAQAQRPGGGLESPGRWAGSSQVKEGRAGKRTELDTPAHGSASVCGSVGLSASSLASIQSQQVSTSDSTPPKAVPLSQQAETTAQGRTHKKAADGIDAELSMVDANTVSDPDGPWSREGESREGESREGESREGPSTPRPSALALPASLSRHMSKAGPQPEPNLNAARRVRSVGGPRKAEGEKEAGLKPTLQKLLTSAGSQRKVNWREMYQEVDRKKQEKVKGMPRFGIELVGPLFEPDGFPVDEDGDGDIPLTEGFHWESTQLEHPPPPPAPHPQTTPAPQRPSEAPLPGVERPRAPPVCVKAEPGWDGGLDRRAGDGQGKRRVKNKRKQDSELPGVSGLNPSGKRQKVKSKNDQVQVDQLLAVSLKEEELCTSMQTVDSSLIQARNALQAAYAEVQRLLLVKQQVTDEINSLRAKRIEILQGMQGGQNPLPYPLSNLYPSSILPPTVPSPPTPSLTASLTASLRPLTPVQPSPPPMANPLHPAPAILPNRAIKQEAVLSHSLPAVPPPSQQRAVSSAPVASLPASRPPEGRRRVKLEAESEMSDSSSTASDSEEEQEGPAAGGHDGQGGDDGSVKMVEIADVVVEIEDSDAEDVPEGHDPAGHASSHPPPPPPQRHSPSLDSLEVSSSSTQTFIPPTHIKGVRIKEDPHERVCPAEVPEDVEPSVGSFLGHTGPVHALQIHAGLLYTCSGDSTARAYSLGSRECQSVFKGHSSKINCLLVSSPPRLPTRLYTGSSDETVRCFSTKSQKCLDRLSLPDRVLCLHVAWNILYVGLANGSVVSFDVKTLRQLDVFECHGPRGVSCLASCQEGARRVLLVGSYDSTISVRDAKSSLLLRSLHGHTKTVLCSKVVNDLVFSGSSDTSVHAHNIHTGELVRIYKGHTHAVTAVEVLGKVMVTACLDKLVRVYELQSHDRLQVYGGHSDMVMCMAVHKSVIYTGCYDGTVQAVKLNLMENYRCWWHGCCLIFGVKDHLLQHLLGDHSNPQQPTLKCRWRDCDFFTGKNSPKELPVHMQTHVEMDSKLDT